MNEPERRPKVSVVIPVYNEADTIQEILRRVAAVRIDKEIVVVDDFSTDGTRDVLRQLEAGGGDHGLLSWTPILCLAIIGLFMWEKINRLVAGSLLASALAYYYLIASYPAWDGLSSFGSRYFLSVTPIFVFDLTAFLSGCAAAWKAQRAMAIAARTLAALLIAWNLLFMFQWGTHMIPVRGDISFKAMARAQFTTAPVRLKDTLLKYLTHRNAMMNQIENMDVQQIREQQHREHPNLP
jgi:glycosyltransferase involved in cell wall biosynthesis